MSKKHYPSTPNKTTKFADNVKSLNNHMNTQQPNQSIPYSPLVKIEDADFNKKLQDHWQNNIANLNTGNSLTQYSHFILNRMGYQDLAMLASDDIINNAIETITREMLSKGGQIVVNCGDGMDALEIKEFLDQRAQELDMYKILSEAIKKSLIFGGSLVYINMGGEQELGKPLIIAKETSGNKLKALNVLEAWQISPAQTNLSNPLDKDYMKPSQWYVSGVGSVDSTRFYPLVFFEVPNLIKPLFNFMGISLTQFMMNKVKDSESMRQSLADIFLRFKTDIIRTPALTNMDANQLRERVQLINMSKNNTGTMLLTDLEQWEQTITPTAGLDKLYAQSMEAIASSARMPINKLFGQTPTGLNNSGEYDIQSFYDTIRGYQDSTIKPLLLHIYNIILNERYADLDISLDYIYNPLKQLNDLEIAQAKNLQADYYTKLISAGIITQSEALNELKKQDLLGSDIQGADDDMNIDLGEDIDLEIPSLSLDNG